MNKRSRWLTALSVVALMGTGCVFVSEPEQEYDPDLLADVASDAAASGLSGEELFQYVQDELAVAGTITYVERIGLREGHVHGNGSTGVHELGDSKGFGDASIGAYWQFWNGVPETSMTLSLGTYVPTGEDGRPDAGPRTGLVLWLLKAGGEPWLWSIRPEDLGTFLQGLGWTIPTWLDEELGKHGLEIFAVAQTRKAGGQSRAPE